VRRRFGQLLETLTITRTQREDGETKQAAVRACLNRWYWDHGSETANSMLIGSWGKDTRVRPSRDIDILFLLPSDVYWRFQSRSENRQSQLLQEVKYALGQTYSQTTLRGDGQVISVPFSSTPIEIVPGFRCTDGSVIICDANDGGKYKTSTAEAEAYLVCFRNPFSEFEADSKPLFERLEKARSHMLTPPEWCFKLARRKHKDGHYHHDYDERTNVATALERDGVAHQGDAWS
jgi:hypothetical protein